MERVSLEHFERTLEASSIDLGTLELRADGTIAEHSSEDEAGPDVDLEDLMTLASEEGRSELHLRAVLAEGGLGIVREAEQTSLGRIVAVKTLRPEVRNPARDRAFVIEARVTGVLEHPSIVPVHALGRGPDGAPLMVMKKVTGRPWSELIRETLGEPEHLTTHLRILATTCQAVELAHSRGVLHRDLKPDNVMVGDFGEVTVVDWGLSVAIDEAPVEGLRRAADVHGVVGTPCYMAPEMAAGNGARMGPATDVYLLGATLHEVLTGEARHQGDTLLALLYVAFASEPHEYGSDVPAELAAIANRACAAEPKDRFESVRAFREALERYEEHTSSRALTEAAYRRLRRFDPDAEESNRTTLTECRFAFRQALGLWPENDAAKGGLQDTLLHMIEGALARDELTTAESLLAELDASTPELEAELESLRGRLEARTERVRTLEAREREADLGAASNHRRTYGMVFGVLFPLVNIALGVLELVDVLTLQHWSYLAVSATVACSVVVFAIPRVQHLVPNRASRMLLAAVGALLVMQSPGFLAMGWLGLSLHASLAVSLFQLGGTVVVASMLVRPAFAYVGGVIVLLGISASLYEPSAYFCVAMSYALVILSGTNLTWEDRMSDHEGAPEP